jgi:hypothetical protein
MDLGHQYQLRLHRADRIDPHQPGASAKALGALDLGETRRLHRAGDGGGTLDINLF